MTALVTLPADFDFSPEAAAAAADWVVEIPMPYLPDGKPAGWLGSNDPKPTGKKINWWYAKRNAIANAWRAAAYQALCRAGVPTGLDLIELRIGYRFTTAKGHGRDLPNLEATVKPVQDALRPTKTQLHGSKLVTMVGAGIVADDNQRHILRGPEVLIGKPVGTKTHVKGVMILYIRRLEPAEVSL